MKKKKTAGNTVVRAVAEARIRVALSEVNRWSAFLLMLDEIEGGESEGNQAAYQAELLCYRFLHILGPQSTPNLLHLLKLSGLIVPSPPRATLHSWLKRSNSLELVGQALWRIKKGARVTRNEVVSLVAEAEAGLTLSVTELAQGDEAPAEDADRNSDVTEGGLD